MFKSKIVSILVAIKKNELNELTKFVNSSFIDADIDIKNLFSYLIKYYPQFKDKHLEKATVQAYITPNEVSDKKFRYISSALIKIIESFIAYKALQENSYLYDTLLVKEYINRNCYKPLSLILQDFKKKLDSAIIVDSDFYYYKFLHIENEILSNQITSFQRETQNDIEGIINELDNFYLSKKLQLICFFYNQKNLLSVNHELPFLKETLLSLKNGSTEPIVNIYYHILLTLTEYDSENSFWELKKLLNEYSNRFTNQEAKEMYAFAQNYCIKQINNGNLLFQKELLDLYKSILKNKLIFTGKFISQWDYKNIVTISLRLNDFKWSENFIEEYKKYLIPKECENAYAYNLANVHFYKQDYKSTLQLLQKVEFTDVFYQLDTRSIILKTYYELKDEDGFYYHIKAFKSFLSRNKSQISSYQYLIYSNLVKFTERIYKINPEEKDKIGEIKNQIEQNKQIADLSWLKQKINNIEKK